jgi:hypothetical protein
MAIDQRDLRVETRAHRLALGRHHHRLRRLAKRIGRRVFAQAAVCSSLVIGALEKELQIVMRQAVALVDDAGTLGLDADARRPIPPGARR